MAALDCLKSPFPIKIYTMPQLAANPGLLYEVVKLINTACLNHKHLEGGQRYEYDMQLVEEGGADTLCAIMYSNDKMIASASLQPWRPEQGGPVDEALKTHHPNEYPLLESELSWQVKAVATLDSLETRGKGLAVHCISALQDRVFLLHPEAKTRGLLLWVTTAENQNGPYWRRRGFQLVGESELKPKGFWGAYEEFWYSTLMKKVGRPP